MRLRADSAGRRAACWGDCEAHNARYGLGLWSCEFLGLRSGLADPASGSLAVCGCLWIAGVRCWLRKSGCGGEDDACLRRRVRVVGLVADSVCGPVVEVNPARGAPEGNHRPHSRRAPPTVCAASFCCGRLCSAEGGEESDERGRE